MGKSGLPVSQDRALSCLKQESKAGVASVRKAQKEMEQEIPEGQASVSCDWDTVHEGGLWKNKGGSSCRE